VDNVIQEIAEILQSLSGAVGETVVVCEELETFEQASSGEAIITDIIQQYKEEESHEKDTQEDEEDDEVLFDDRIVEDEAPTVNEALKSLKTALKFASKEGDPDFENVLIQKIGHWSRMRTERMHQPTLFTMFNSESRK
jgi:hypothetical protein